MKVPNASLIALAGIAGEGIASARSRAARRRGIACRAHISASSPGMVITGQIPIKDAQRCCSLSSAPANAPCTIMDRSTSCCTRAERERNVLYPRWAIALVSREGARPMDADEFIAANEITLREPKNHGWEKKFVDRVLRQVNGLDFSNVRAQSPLRDAAGKYRRIDFTIEEPGERGVRIALEVDGWAKTGSGEGMSRADFLDWFRREQAVLSQGWRVLRFANPQVRDEPAECARLIQRMLEMERGLSARLASAEHWAVDLADELRRAETRAAQAEFRLGEALRAADAADAGADATQLVALRRVESEESHRALAVVVADAAAEVLPAADAKELREGDIRREIALRKRELEFDALTRRVAEAERENQGMRTMAIACAAIVITVMVGALLLTGGNDNSPQGAAVTLDPGPCGSAIDWSEASGRVGRSATIAGPVVSATYRDRSRGKPTFLNVGRPFGDDGRFVVVVFGVNRSKFPRPPERAYDDQRIAVTGVVKQFRGVPQIEVNTPSQIERC